MQRMRLHVGLDSTLDSFSGRAKAGLPGAVSFLTRKGKKNRAAKPTSVLDGGDDEQHGGANVHRGFRELEA